MGDRFSSRRTFFPASIPREAWEQYPAPAVLQRSAQQPEQGMTQAQAAYGQAVAKLRNFTERTRGIISMDVVPFAQAVKEGAHSLMLQRLREAAPMELLENLRRRAQGGLDLARCSAGGVADPAFDLMDHHAPPELIQALTVRNVWRPVSPAPPQTDDAVNSGKKRSRAHLSIADLRLLPPICIKLSPDGQRFMNGLDTSDLQKEIDSIFDPVYKAPSKEGLIEYLACASAAIFHLSVSDPSKCKSFTFQFVSDISGIITQAHANASEQTQEFRQLIQQFIATETPDSAIFAINSFKSVLDQNLGMLGLGRILDARMPKQKPEPKQTKRISSTTYAVIEAFCNLPRIRIKLSPADQQIISCPGTPGSALQVKSGALFDSLCNAPTMDLLAEYLAWSSAAICYLSDKGTAERDKFIFDFVGNIQFICLNRNILNEMKKEIRQLIKRFIAIEAPDSVVSALNCQKAQVTSLGRMGLTEILNARATNERLRKPLNWRQFLAIVGLGDGPFESTDPPGPLVRQQLPPASGMHPALQMPLEEAISVAHAQLHQAVDALYKYLGSLPRPDFVLERVISLASSIKGCAHWLMSLYMQQAEPHGSSNFLSLRDDARKQLDFASQSIGSPYHPAFVLLEGAPPRLKAKHADVTMVEVQPGVLRTLAQATGEARTEYTQLFDALSKSAVAVDLVPTLASLVRDSALWLMALLLDNGDLDDMNQIMDDTGDLMNAAYEYIAGNADPALFDLRLGAPDDLASAIHQRRFMGN